MQWGEAHQEPGSLSQLETEITVQGSQGGLKLQGRLPKRMELLKDSSQISRDSLEITAKMWKKDP